MQPDDHGAGQGTKPSNLMADRSFWGMLCTQFLGAFNDNLYKQLMLLLAIPAVVAGAAAADASGDADVQGWATLVFSIPFVLFSGFAGYISDRYAKTPIIVICKIAEIAVMFLGLLAFYYYDLLGMTGTWIVLFLMGTQSAFFGPGKYGVLPELFAPKDLPRANGLILMTTFLAIIFGTVLAGRLKDALAGADGSAHSLWIGLLVCVGIAIAGTMTSLLVRKTPPAQPDIRLTADCWGVSRDVYQMLSRDRILLLAVLVSSVFWLVSGITVPVVNRLGLGMLGADATNTSNLTASIAIGIMFGALGASWLCRKGFGDRCVNWGLWGIFVSLVALGLWNGNQHVLGYWGSAIALIAMGVFAAIFAIPIQVFLQDRPPANLKGRMIATMNQANFIGILISGPLYQVFEATSRWLGWPICSVFWMMGLLILPVAIFYRLDSQPTRA
ncbi:MAG: MFS transporter [Pirellulaceae bacterium]